MSSSSNLLGFDQVVALSQQTINSQLAFVWQQSLLDFVFDLNVDADNYVHATTGIPVVNINLPTEGEVNYKKVVLKFPLTGGSAHGVSFGTPVGVDDLTGYTFQVGVNIGQADPLAANSGLAVPSVIQQRLNAMTQNIYSISSVILDIDNINYTDTDCVVLDPEGNEVPSLETMLSSFISSVKNTAGGNPFLLVFNTNLLPSATGMSGIPAFYPTSAQYRTEFYDENFGYDDRNTLNMMIMTQNDTPPEISATQGYPVYLGPGASPPDGLMTICAEQFNSDYIYDLVLKQISDSMQHALIDLVSAVTTNVPKQQFSDKNFFSVNGDEWKFNWSYSDGTPGDKDTYGDSPVIGKDSGISDVHQITQVSCSCTVSAPESTPDGKGIVLSVSGNVKAYGDWYERIVAWVHDGQVLVCQNFATSITIQPGASSSGTPGALSVSLADVTKSKGKVKNENGTSYDSPHYYEWPVGAVLDFIASIFGASTFKEIADDFEADANSAIGKFFNDFQTDANNALGTLSSNVILPTGDAYLFDSAQLDTEGNPKFTFTVNSF